MANIGKYIALGSVIEVYPDKYTALINVEESFENETGRNVECKITALKFTTQGSANVVFPMPGDRVYVSFQNDKMYPFIVGYHMPTDVTPRYSDYQDRLTPIRDVGGEDKTYQGGSNFSRGKAASDVLPGDQITTGDDGQALGILTGGTILAKAHALCQIVLTKSRQTMLLVSRRLKIYTDFGEITSESENGKAFLQIRGNTSTNETNGTQGVFNNTLRLGGKDLININLENKFSLVADTAGHTTVLSESINILTENNYDIRSGKSLRIATDGSKSEYVGSTSDSLVKGARSLNIRGKNEVTVSGADSKTVGGNSRSTYQGVKTDVIKGVDLLATETVAYEAKIGAGDYIIDIGNPSAGGLPAPILLPNMGSFKVNVLAGDIEFSTLKGDYKFDTLLGGWEFTTLLGDIKLSTTAGDVELSTLLGTAKLSSTIKASVESDALAEIKGQLISLEHTMANLSGGGSSDSVVLALKLTQKILTSIMLTFNTHTHPPVFALVAPLSAPVPIPVIPPMTQMTPITPLDISKASVLA